MSNQRRIFFTSDTHFLHGNIIKTRPRYETLEAMTETYIDRWNSQVRPQDFVYHLGDFALSWGKKKSADPISRILGRLAGHKHLIKGNHDRDEVTKNDAWVWVKDYHELKIDIGGEHKQRIVLCHYPIRSWNQLARGAWMLHGHCHNNLPDTGGKILDIGVDRWGGPIPLHIVKWYMEERPIAFEDHHTPATDEIKIESSDQGMREATDALISEIGFFGNHPLYTRPDWVAEAVAGDTALGYWQWVVHQAEAE